MSTKHNHSNPTRKKSLGGATFRKKENSQFKTSCTFKLLLLFRFPRFFYIQGSKIQNLKLLNRNWFLTKKKSSFLADAGAKYSKLILRILKKLHWNYLGLKDWILLVFMIGWNSPSNLENRINSRIHLFNKCNKKLINNQTWHPNLSTSAGTKFRSLYVQ